jgi:hypothetical protein
MTINMVRAAYYREAEEACAADPIVRLMFETLPPEYVEAIAADENINGVDLWVLMRQANNTYERLTGERQREIGAVLGGLRIIALEALGK